MPSEHANLPIWLAKLDLVRAELAATTWPATPAEGLLATCRLSDDMRIIALSGLRHQHPSASEEELETLLYEFRCNWERSCPRYRSKTSLTPKTQ